MSLSGEKDESGPLSGPGPGPLGLPRPFRQRAQELFTHWPSPGTGVGKGEGSELKRPPEERVQQGGWAQQRQLKLCLLGSPVCPSKWSHPSPGTHLSLLSSIRSSASEKFSTWSPLGSGCTERTTEECECGLLVPRRPTTAGGAESQGPGQTEPPGARARGNGSKSGALT